MDRALTDDDYRVLDALLAMPEGHGSHVRSVDSGRLRRSVVEQCLALGLRPSEVFDGSNVEDRAANVGSAKHHELHPYGTPEVEPGSHGRLPLLNQLNELLAFVRDCELRWTPSTGGTNGQNTGGR